MTSKLALTVQSFQARKRTKQRRAKNAFCKYRSLGHELAQKQQYDDAISYYLKALFTRPGGTQIAYDIGDVLKQQELLEEADFCYRNHNVPEQIIKKYSKSGNSWKVNDSFSTEKVLSSFVYQSHRTSVTSPKSIEKFIGVSSEFNKTTVDFSKAFVALIPNGRGWSNHLTSAIMTEDNCLLADISTGASNSIAASEKLCTPLKVDGIVAFLSSRWGSAAYFHWMLDPTFISPTDEVHLKSG